jgi:hypothetical protein
MKFTHWAKTKRGEPKKKMVTDLPPGILSEEARHIFQHGHCHSFALALAKLTGGAVYGYLGWDWRTVLHIYVRLPNSNLFVDAKEMFDYALLPKGGLINKLPPDYKFTPMRKGIGWFKAQPEKAMSFAVARLAEIQESLTKEK